MILCLVSTFLFAGCSLILIDEREHIMENGPEWAWKIIVRKAVHAECERLNDVVTNYANQEIQDYQVMGMQDDVDQYNLLSAFNLELFYSSGGADRNRAVKRYKERYSKVIPLFFENMMEAAERPESLGYDNYSWGDDVICERLIGTPGKISRESPEDLEYLAHNIVGGIKDTHPMPSVASCKYDTHIKQWDAILSNGSHLYVMVVRDYKKGEKTYYYSLGHPYAAEDEY